MKNNIPTAEQFYRQAINDPTIGDHITDLMNAYAKIHVEAALKSVYNNIEYTTENSSVPYVVEESIINSYPLTNIK